MKTQLIMLDIPIIINDEEIKDGDDFIDLRDLKQGNISDYDIYKAGLGGDVEFANKIGKKIIAGIEGLPSIDWNGLEEEFGWIDVEKLSKVDIKFHHKNIQEREIDYILGYEDGFKKAQSLNEKKFSLEDMKTAIKIAREGRTCIGGGSDYVEDGEADDCVNWYYTDKTIIQSLQQPKVFDIEVELEEKVKWVRNTSRNIPTKDDLDRV